MLYAENNFLSFEVSFFLNLGHVMIYRHQDWGREGEGVLTVSGSIPSSQEQWIDIPTGESTGLWRIPAVCCHCLVASLSSGFSVALENRETRLGQGRVANPQQKCMWQTQRRGRDGPKHSFPQSSFSSHLHCCVRHRNDKPCCLSFWC